MSFELPALPYAHDALEPHIDTRTMEIHHANIMLDTPTISTLQLKERAMKAKPLKRFLLIST